MSEVVNLAKRAMNAAEPAKNTALDSMMFSGMAWMEMMLRLQRASLQSFSTYSPSSETRISGALPQRSTGVEVIPVGEERLNVATRVVQGETIRVRRRVVEQPVEQEVTLREETVVVERRPRPAGAAAGEGANVLSETVVEMSDSRQVPTVWKSVHVGEEVVLRKQVVERTEKVRETLRRDIVDVEHDRAAPQLAHHLEVETKVVPARRAGEIATSRDDTQAEAARHRAEVAEARERVEAQAEEARQRIEAAVAEQAKERAETQPSADSRSQQDRKPGSQGPVAGPGRKA